MKNGFDINRISGDGYLVLPLSMSRLTSGQSPEEVYAMVDFFASKVEEYSNDVVFLYTNGLYFNSEDISFEARKKLNQQVLSHVSAMRNLIAKKKQYMPRAFHYLPIDYVILNSPYFDNFFTKLRELEKEDSEFKEAIQKDMGDRGYSEANVNFILEEVTVAHIVRQRLVSFPRTLVRDDVWRLLCYPGGYIHADAYQWKNQILPQRDEINPYNSGQYDFSSKVFNDYSSV